MATPAIPNAFQQLVEDLSTVLGPSSGINDVDTERLIALMERYVSIEDEWKNYAFSDSSRPYTRNLVDEGNGKSNLLILVWTPGKGSAIHDHGSHCIMKVLKGELTETLYDWPDQRKASGNGSAPLVPKRETRYQTNQVTYMSDELGIHRVGNPDTKEFAISLHLYTPPHVSKNGCHIFNARTGAHMHCNGVLYSKYGERVRS
ncbi:cysteine dioxygenase type I [Pseudovirgaria hyperparasitica]|uniref:Cysteine dioxygenase n=1 Tax=Pseudovirgaria hyperparasitica TaxID=470096 RepID=A0A6A6W7G9_9PEZI|nr:cysteine dioxygenase type I [Pseudovirgaria hyperparasitica]KAF2757826.1 cysteine dioxygenase type I [Pseudovirgaria hyperparasitica]